MKKIFILALATLTILGCSKDPISVSESNNKDIQVELLFEYEGCKMFRFKDGDNDHYFTKCINASSQTISPRMVTQCVPVGKGMICRQVDDGQELIGEGLNK
jgi:hypothetical protein